MPQLYSKVPLSISFANNCVCAFLQEATNYVKGHLAVLAYRSESETPGAMLQEKISELLVLVILCLQPSITFALFKESVLQAVRVVNLFGGDGQLMGTDEFEAMEPTAALSHLRASNFPLTYEFFAYVSAVALYPHSDPKMHSMGSEISCTNVLFGTLYHFVIKEVIIKALRLKLIDEFMNLVEPGFHTYEAVFTLSDNKDIELVKWCDDQSIEVPELKEFYFQRPSKFSRPYVTEADSEESASGKDDSED